MERERTYASVKPNGVLAKQDVPMGGCLFREQSTLFVSHCPGPLVRGRTFAKVVFAWEPPIIDGGAAVFEYEVSGGHAHPARWHIGLGA